LHAHLRYCHANPRVQIQALVGLINGLHRAVNPEFQRDLLPALIRLYHREGAWNREACWGDTPGYPGALLQTGALKTMRPNRQRRRPASPNAQVAQGFATASFELKDGSSLEGFIVRESGDEIELRNIAGVARLIRKKQIDRRGNSD
jgi:hypothetical protein